MKTYYIDLQNPAVVAWCVRSSTFSFSRSLRLAYGGSNPIEYGASIVWGEPPVAILTAECRARKGL